MNEDLISGNFTDNVNRLLIKNNLRLVNIIFSLLIIYTILDIADWLITLNNIHFTGTPKHIYNYRVHPAIALFILTVGMVSWSWITKANKLINAAFDKNDAEDFNAGYALFCRSNNVIIASYIVSIISVSIRIFFKY